MDLFSEQLGRQTEIGRRFLFLLPLSSANLGKFRHTEGREGGGAASCAMSEGNFTRCFEHVDDNTESEIDEAITSAFDFVVQWLEEEEAKEVKAALERREVSETQRKLKDCQFSPQNSLHVISKYGQQGATDIAPKCVSGEGLPGPLARGVEQAGVDGCGQDLQVEVGVAQAGQGAVKLIYNCLVMVISWVLLMVILLIDITGTSKFDNYPDEGGASICKLKSGSNQFSSAGLPPQPDHLSAPGRHPHCHQHHHPCQQHHWYHHPRHRHLLGHIYHILLVVNELSSWWYLLRK